MTAVKDIFGFLNDMAPVKTKMDFDNVGILVGHSENKVNKVLTALDITDDVIDEAIEKGADLIVSHHPMFFSLKSVSDADPVGRRILKMISNGISAICMHTNLDAAEGGVNDVLAEKAGIKEPEMLTIDGYDESGKPYCIGRFGEIEEETEFSDYLGFIKKQLNCGGLRYCYGGKKVKRVAVMGGSGGSEIELAVKNGCDTFVTADVKYHQFLDARDVGINIIDADHFCTENVIIPVLAEKTQNKFSEIDVFVSKKHRQTICFFNT